MKKESVLEIEFTPVWDKWAWRIRKQNEEVLKLGNFRDDELKVMSTSLIDPSFVTLSNYLYLKSSDLNDTVNICNDIVKRIIQDKVEAVNEKYGVEKRWRANRGGDYFYIEDHCLICEDIDCNYNEDNVRYNFGNYFETEEEAEKYLEYMKKCSLEWDEREEGQMEQWEMMAKMVKEFYLAFKQEEFLNKDMTEERGHLRDLLLMEEKTEYMKAEIENDIVGKLDAVVDMAYVYIGTLLEQCKGNVDLVARVLYFDTMNPELIGIFNKIEKNNFNGIFLLAFKEVHRSNMTKLDKNGKPVYYTKGAKKGKIAKSELFEEPNLKEIIEGEDKIETSDYLQ